MPRLVEDVGKPLFAAWLAQVHRLTGWRRGFRWVGGRRVLWALGRSCVTVIHSPADGIGGTVYYNVGLTSTKLPPGGSRWWWLCPGCGRRVDILYLPAERDRLGCRACCGLKYRSQYVRRKVRRRKWRPIVAGEQGFRTWVWLGPWRRR